MCCISLYGTNPCHYYHVSYVDAGEYVLGDLGSSCHLGQRAHEHTLTHWAAEYASITSANFFQLAVTLMKCAGRCELTDSPSLAKCQDSTDQLANEELKSFVSGLLQTPP